MTNHSPAFAASLAAYAAAKAAGCSTSEAFVIAERAYHEAKKQEA